MEDPGDQFKATRQVLEMIGLANDEMNVYFNMMGRGTMMIGEVALLSNVPEERTLEIAQKLVEKGLIREVPGKTPMYSALPPYVALLSQLRQFKDVVKNIKNAAPIKLEGKFELTDEHSAKLEKFGEYLNYVREMKNKIPAQLKNDFKNIEKELEQVKNVYQAKKFITNLKQIVPDEITREFQNMSSVIDNVKTEISKKFETTFRVGALKNMAEKIVANVLSAQFENMTSYFRDRFVTSTQTMLDQVSGQLGSISEESVDITADLDGTYLNIEAGLTRTLDDLESRLTQVHKDVMDGIEEIKGMFRKEVFESLQDDVIMNIIKQMEMAELTMNEFWERAKLAGQQSYKDVWFIRSFEAMIAQINDSLSRVKMRFHIIAPKLENIDMVALSRVKKHVNIRISTSFDPTNPSDQEKLNQIEQRHNFSIRFYPRENLWALNKDFEEVVVCVLSKTPGGGMEIAGMGSVLDEHIKLLVAVLEDIWIQSKKLETLGLSRF